MTYALRQWQAIIEFSTDPEWMNQVNEFGNLYGGSVNELRKNVEAFLLDKNPIFFRCEGDHIGGQRRFFYSDGKRALTLSPGKGPQILPEGWWYQQEPLAELGKHLLSNYSVQALDSFELAVKHFVYTSLVPIKGPDYQTGAVVENSLRLFLLDKVLREKDEKFINDLIRRGWHIIALEYEGESSRTGELVSRRAQFVLGHSDHNAAQATLVARDMNE